ncbi:MULTISPECIES: hypothetical protein [unclassified Nostoc]|uniref:hypothetical protein n=1 Tax=unclassified Nostoc TaxID=2593658 RepID=UPI002AD29843|nr:MULTISPECIES: hypothetical protein [unclassified Nostoc]MDZ8124378.1 hypothetical protein [Nostoc sp. CmiVER01]MDZ8227439.1 hypothetical protein [Nostoc sp. ChiVER01]
MKINKEDKKRAKIQSITNLAEEIELVDLSDEEIMQVNGGNVVWGGNGNDVGTPPVKITGFELNQF